MHDIIMIMAVLDEIVCLVLNQIHTCCRRLRELKKQAKHKSSSDDRSTGAGDQSGKVQQYICAPIDCCVTPAYG